ncbi:class I SAM-dependent methyltransferase [Bosea vestrisii]|uniref:Class I SAM-dependent methyltransferase n=1 Tax=Bosea vestrisii TaxID=151416 RepID=A0ABW0HHW5_9HYPH
MADIVDRMNVYDHPHFFEGYRALRESDRGLNGALEIPALRALLPELAAKIVLDLGCGFGDFARYVRKHGARSVTAIDLSQRMLGEARRLTTDSEIVFVHARIEDHIPDPEAYDLVVSSLALHYLADIRDVFQRVFRALRPSGTFIFSVEHPMCTAHPVGWVRDGGGQATHWPVDRYQDEGMRKTRWFIDGVVKYHRTIETYVNALLSTGFQLDALCEPKPTAEALCARPSLMDELRRPPVLLLRASRR